MRSVIALFLLLIALPAWAATEIKSMPVLQQHQICQTDSQCQLITTGCSCVCGDSRIYAVNKTYASLYIKLAHCSQEQYTACQTSPCNPPFLEQRAECVQGTCVPEKLKLPPTKPKR